MKTNLITNFIQTQNNQPQKKEAPDFNIRHELANKTFIKPLKGQGRLIKGNIFDAPSNMISGISYDFKALKNGINGDANDHQLGKLNDFGMKLGGLAIAGYLYTKRQTPLTKTMEFVGLGSFFASMALWPKLAIQLPARLIHGFNVQQKYEDSFGRKKPFFQDPQFLPWDLYSDDEINKIGDRMGVPKNLPNRRAFIQEKMKKIAIQNNTLWMLTAGFATPIMSALICNQLEKPLSKPLSLARNANTDAILNNPYKGKQEEAKVPANIEKQLLINRNKPLTDSLIDEFAVTITKSFEPQVTEAVKTDIKNFLKTSTFVINANTVNAIAKNSKETLLASEFPEELVDKIIPSQDEIKKFFDIEKGYFGNDYTADQIEEIFGEYSARVRTNIKKYNELHPEAPLSKFQKQTIINLIVEAEDAENPILKALKQEKSAILNEENQNAIRTIAAAFDKLKKDLDVVNKYILHKTGFAPETSLANHWNKTIQTLLKDLNVSPEDMELSKDDRLLSAKMLKNHYDEIASDKTSYKKVISDLINNLAELNKLISKADINDDIFGGGKESKFNKRIDEIFAVFEANIKKLPGFQNGDMEFSFDNILGSRANIDSARNENGSLKSLYKKMVKDRITGFKSSFYRIINSLDLHRRLAKGDKSYFPALHAGMPRETKEEIVELAKFAGISGHSADYLTKFFMAQNPQPAADFGDIEIKNGKLVYKYFNLDTPKGKVERPFDQSLYRETMKLLYENSILDETTELFKGHKELLEEFKAYRSYLLNEVGNKRYIEKIHHSVNTGVSSASDNMIYQMVGAATDQVLRNNSLESFNTKTWLKMFGGAGAALLGLTVLAQFFFGRVKIPKAVPNTNANRQEVKKG